MPLGRALVIGASGFLGQRLVDLFGLQRAVGTYHSRPVQGYLYFDATSDTLQSLLARAGSGITHVYLPYGTINPEECVRSPAMTAKVNVDSMKRMIAGCFELGLVPVFVSSDYVYDGSRGMRTESEPQCPNTEYGRQKAAIETWLEENDSPWIVTRLSKVVGGEIGAQSVLGQAISAFRKGEPLRMATDQIFSPAWVDDVARAMIVLAEKGTRGVVHVAGSEAVSRYDLIQLLAKAVTRRVPALKVQLTACRLHDLPFIEKRPLNTSISTERLQTLIDWRFKTMATLCDEIAESNFDVVDR